MAMESNGLSHPTEMGEDPQTTEVSYNDADHGKDQDCVRILDLAVSQSLVLRTFKQENAQYHIQTARTLFAQPEKLPHNLTARTLAGPGKLPCAPHILICDETASLLASYYLGSKLSGDTGVVHGGMLSVLLDECMGRACLPRLPIRMAVTAKLDVSFHRPVPVDSVIHIKVWCEKAQGRKVWMKGMVLDDTDDDQPCVEAAGLFVQPRDASPTNLLM